MDLSRAALRHCRTPIFYFEGDTWLESEVQGRLAVYDRFISDRAFGQKVRLLQVPGEEFLPRDRYIRVGSSVGITYIVQSVNEDRNEHSSYMNTYMIRSADNEVEIYHKVEKTIASGQKKTSWELLTRAWGDFDRQGTLNSDELDVSYSAFVLNLPLSQAVPPDARFKIAGRWYAPMEDYRMLETLQIRMRGINGEPT